MAAAAAAGAGRAVAVGRARPATRPTPGNQEPTGVIPLPPKSSTTYRRRPQQPPRPPQQAPPPPPAPPAPSDPAPPARPSVSLPGPRFPNAGAAVNTAAGFVLGLLFWGWIALPFITGGPGRVRAVWRAKFLNKGPDGKPLP